MQNCQWGVGQGGFHTLHLEVVSEKSKKEMHFNAVYDCGGELPALETNISHYIDWLVLNRHQTVDCIYLSHLDEDHYGGIRYLLSELRKQSIAVRNIFIPHLTPLERLVIAVESQLRQSEKVNTSGSLVDPLGLTDPVRNLRESFPEVNIVELTSDVNPDGEDTEEVPPRWRTYGELPEATLQVDQRRGMFRLSTAKISREIWQLIPTVDSRADDMTHKVRNAVEGDSGIGINDVADLTTQDIEALLSDKSRTAELARALKKHSIGAGTDPGMDTSFSNCSSIILYWGPTAETAGTNAQTEFQILPFGDDFEACGELAAGTGKVFGWLGTGDADLGSKKPIDNLFKNIKDVANNIEVVSAPHHGARKNSTRLFWNKLKNLRVVTFEYGASNRYGHPSPEVVAYGLLCGSRCVHIKQGLFVFSQEF